MSNIAVIRRQMLLNLHRVVQHPADTNESRADHAIKQDMARLADTPFTHPPPLTAMTQVIAAHSWPKLWTGSTSYPFRLVGDIAKCCDQQNFVTAADDFTKVIFSPGKQRDDIGLC